MAKELQSFNFSDGPEIVCVSLTQGPFGIESQADVESVKLPLRNIVSDRKDIDAFVIACYSDPGLQVCREATDRPVFGIQECGVLVQWRKATDLVSLLCKSVPYAVISCT